MLTNSSCEFHQRAHYHFSRPGQLAVNWPTHPPPSLNPTDNVFISNLEKEKPSQPRDFTTFSACCLFIYLFFVFVLPGFWNRSSPDTNLVVIVNSALRLKSVDMRVDLLDKLVTEEKKNIHTEVRGQLVSTKRNSIIPPRSVLIALAT